VKEPIFVNFSTVWGQRLISGGFLGSFNVEVDWLEEI